MSEKKSLLCQTGNATHVQMMGFILRTPDGKVICVDGGTANDAEHYYEALCRICQSETTHVDAWFLTHAHSDHINAFLEIMRQHDRKELTVDAVYYHFPSIQFVQKTEPIEAVTVENFYKALPGFADRIVVVTQGDSYTVGESEWKVLYTADPVYRTNSVNNASAIYQVTMGGKTILFLGDLGVEAGAKLLKMCGAELKSDICQMAHHGQNGVDEDVYQAIRPEICFWCAPDWLWENRAGCHKTLIVRGWMEKLGVKENYVEKDGDAIIEW